MLITAHARYCPASRVGGNRSPSLRRVAALSSLRLLVLGYLHKLRQTPKRYRSSQSHRDKTARLVRKHAVTVRLPSMRCLLREFYRVKLVSDLRLRDFF